MLSPSWLSPGWFVAQLTGDRVNSPFTASFISDSGLFRICTMCGQNLCLGNVKDSWPALELSSAAAGRGLADHSGPFGYKSAIHVICFTDVL